MRPFGYLSFGAIGIRCLRLGADAVDLSWTQGPSWKRPRLPHLISSVTEHHPIYVTLPKFLGFVYIVVYIKSCRISIIICYDRGALE